MTDKHIVTSFDDDLAALNQMIARMGGMAESQLAEAMKALETRNNDGLAELVERDTQLDQLEYQLNERIIEVIAMRAPMAQDLRRVMVSLKVASILERVGDYAKNIAKRAGVIIEEETSRSDNVSLGRMATLVQQMLSQVLDAYATNDDQLAMDVWERDTEVDQMHTSLFRETLLKISENPAQVSSSSHMLFVAKNLERIGDFTTGIAEQVYFLNKGVLPDDRQKDDKSSTASIG